jgi:hypothetical protein
MTKPPTKLRRPSACLPECYFALSGLAAKKKMDSRTQAVEAMKESSFAVAS